MFCPKCGKERADDAEFCKHCGARIVTRAEQIKAPEKPLQEKSGNGKKWGMIGAAAVGLVAVAVLLIVVLGGKNKPAGGQDGPAGETAAGADGVQTDDAGKAMVNLSLCFREVLYNEGLPDTRVILTGGNDNPHGEIIADFTTQSDGTVMTELEAGEYTLCWEAEGYFGGQENLTVSDTEINVVRHMIPVLTEQKAYVLIEWDSDRDLDLCVFNAQTKQYINIMSAVDDAGDFLFYDNDGADGYELICLNDYTAGIYTVYVRDGASLLQGTESIMEAEGLTVSVYTADGLLYHAKADTEETAALWSAVYLYHGEAIELGDYIYDLTDYAWAVRDKHDENYAQNEEVWSAEEDAALLANLHADDSRLRELMEALVHHVSDENIKSLLCGEKKGIENFFAGADPAALALSYVRENQPSNSYELFERTGTAYFLTEEQAQYLLYSICGKQMDFDLSAEDIGIVSHIGFGEFAGDTSWDELERLSVERVDANTWKVRANDVYCCEWEPSRIVSRVCFTVVKNSDSCFDGYSLTGFEVEEKANTSWWAKIYYDYLTTDPEGIAIIENNYGLTWQGQYCYRLIYVDDDMIPEIYLEGRDRASGNLLLYLSNGRVATEYIAYPEYIPYSGLIQDEDGHMGYVWGGAYKLENGNLRKIGDWSGHWSDIDSETGDLYDNVNDIVKVVDWYRLNETDVTKEQYEENINSYTGGAEFLQCRSYDEYYDSLLQYLQGIMSAPNMK